MFHPWGANVEVGMQYSHEPYIRMEMRMLDKQVPDIGSIGDI